MATKKKKGARYWTNKIDKVFHRYIRLRDTDEDGWGECITCNKRLHFSEGQAGHFIGRQHKATRWDVRNVRLQCPKCNCWGHGEQFLYSKAIGQDLADELLQLSRQITKFSEAEYEAIYLKFKQLYDEAEASKKFL